MKLLVLGPDQGEDPLGATNCFAFMAAALMREFSRIIPGSARLVNVDMASDLGSIQGEADFVLFVGYTIVWNRLASCLPEIRKRTGYKKIAVMSDYSFFLNRDGIMMKPDWSFCFLDDDDPRSTVLCAPCVKSYYANEPKEKTILIDHGMIRHKGTEKEWTFRVSDWLEPLKGRYKILRTVQDPNYEVPKPHEVAFPTVPFTEYLRLTNHVESFVITHDETYGYQVIDMIARGIRVVTPEGFLHHDLVKLFQIPTFKNGEELRAILESPVEPRWNEMVNRCTDYFDVAKIIVAKIGNLLSKDRTVMNMTFCKYADVFVPAMATDAIHNDLWPGFREDYLLLHCLLRIFEPKRVVEIGTNVGRGTKIIKNAVGPDSQVFSLDLPLESGPFVSSEYQPGRVGCQCDLPYTQLWGDSRTFDFSPHYPIDAFYVDGEHVYDNVYKETVSVIKANAVLAVYHDANEWEVFKGICDAFYGQPTVGYRLYRVIDTRMMFALRNDVPWSI